MAKITIDFVAILAIDFVLFVASMLQQSQVDLNNECIGEMMISATFKLVGIIYFIFRMYKILFDVMLMFKSKKK